MKRRPDLPDAGAISAMLADRIDALILALGLDGRAVGGGRWEGMAPWPSQDTGPKLSIRLRGTPGQWIHWTSALAGDALDLVAAVLGNGTKNRSEAMKWAIRWLDLLPAESESEADRLARIEANRRRAAEAKARQDRAAAEHRRQVKAMRKRAHALWLEAKPPAPGDGVWEYLAGRGIDLAVWRERCGRLPGAIRAIPSLMHEDEETGEETHWPCMATMLTFPDGSVAAVHLTWVDPSQPGKKAPVNPPRRIWPSPLDDESGVGSSAAIHRGKGGKSKADTPPDTDLVVVCEGMEDALTLALLFPEARVEAAGSLAMLARWAVPACAKEVRVAGDRDWKEAAQKALDRAVVAIAGAGKPTGKIWAPEPFKDWNEALMELGPKLIGGRC